MIIKRELSKKIEKWLKHEEILAIVGLRQIGKMIGRIANGPW